MTTKIALNGRMKGQSSEALDRLAEQLYDNRHRRPVGIVEFAVHKGEWNDPDENERIVRIGIAACEIAAGDQEHILRTAQRGLFLQRTATGTLTEVGDIQYSAAVLEALGEHLDASEAVRQRVALDWAVGQIAKVANSAGLDAAAMRRELKTVVKVLRAALAGQQLKLDSKTVATAELNRAAAEVEAEEAAQLEESAVRLAATNKDPLADHDAEDEL